MQWLQRWARKVLAQTCLEALQAHSEKVKRLETNLLELQTDLEALGASHHRLLKRSVGALGGRPRASNAEIGESDLDSIPKGDKAALRRYFAPEIARRGPGAQQR